MVNIETMFQSASRGVIFKNFLQQLRVTLKQLNDEWNGIELGIIDNPRAFFKVWSAVLFAFCIPPSAEDSANRELFGDGVVWAG